MTARSLTPYQRKKIEQIIRDGHLAFAAELLGPEAISSEDYDRLKRAGKIRDVKLAGGGAASASVVLGAMISRLAPGDAAKMSPQAFWEIVQEQPHLLTDAEHDAVALIRDRIGQYVKGLGNKMDAATGHVLVDADDKARRRKLSKIREAVVAGAASGASGKEVAQAIRTTTGDLKRDWLRIAQTEVHNAVEEGKAVAIASGMPGTDPVVYKRPRPDACPFCKLLYLKPDGVTPRLFRLSELAANGTNVGRRANRPLLKGPRRTEWKPVLGAMHPFCACSLHHMPDGMGFDARGNLVLLRKSVVEVESLDKALMDHVCTTKE